MLGTFENDDRSGRRAMTVAMTPENASRVESLITKDLKMAYVKIHYMKISPGNLNSILHDCLDVRKGCARWVTYNPSEGQKRVEVDW